METGSWKLEVGSQKSEVGSLQSTVSNTQSSVFNQQSLVNSFQFTVNKLIDLNDHNKSALSASEDSRNKMKHDIGQLMTIE